MRPLTVLTGIVLGSSAATSFGLAATLVVFMVLADEHPQFRTELPLLAAYLAIFLGLTALAGISFVGLARERPWLCLLAAVYWQTRG
jgi:hypothetical protein